MKSLHRIHLVCRNDLNVSVRDDGNFETGFWAIASKSALQAREIALHQSKAEMSYRQGRVLAVRACMYEGRPRVIFTVEPSKAPLEWEGAGSGEKGYAWR